MLSMTSCTRCASAHPFAFELFLVVEDLLADEVLGLVERYEDLSLPLDQCVLEGVDRACELEAHVLNCAGVGVDVLLDLVGCTNVVVRRNLLLLSPFEQRQRRALKRRDLVDYLGLIPF